MPLDKPAARITIAAFLALFGVLVVRSAWVSDDAYITFRTIDNFVNGYGLRWNIAERVQAYTHPLWMMLVTAVYWLSGSIYGSILGVSIALSVLTAALIATRLAGSLGGALIAITALAMSKAFVDYSTSGLESPLTHLLLVVFVLRYRRLDFSPRAIFSVWLIAGLLMLNRPDTILLVAPALVLVSWRTGRRSAVPALLGVSAFGAWELFSLAYYGFLVPNTAYAKLNTGLESGELMEQGLYYLLDSISVDPITLFMIALGCLVPVLDRRRGWELSLGIVLSLLYIVRIGGDFMSGRFLTPAFVLAVAQLSSVGWNEVPHLWPAVWILTAALGLSAPHSPLWSGAEYREKRTDVLSPAGITDERNVYYSATGLLNRSRGTRVPDHPRYREGLAERAKGPHIVNLSAIGFFGWAAGPDVHVVDILALADPLLARLPTRRPWQIGHFYRRLPEGYIETLESGESRFRDPNLAAYYAQLRLIVRGPLWTAARWKAIVAMNLGRYEHLVRDYGLVRLSLHDIEAPKAEGTPWNDPGNTILFERGALVDLGRTVSRGSIELTLDHNDEYRLRFWNDGRLVGTRVLLPSIRRDGGLALHRLPVPPGITFNRLGILPVRGDHSYSLGHVRVFEEQGSVVR